MLTQEQRDNLRTLSTFLRQNAERLDFDMSYFAVRYEDEEEATPQQMREYPCGTVACAIGHGPVAGFAPLKNEDWSDYGDRVFGTSEAGLFAGLFSANWEHVDNTPQGAADRIDRYLGTGKVFYPHGEEIIL